ncbi:hypothetical protein ABPG73_010738 [Tetrahymena malaccensis]
MSDRNQKEIGNYKFSINYCLGQGEYGKVFQGVNKITNEDVAIKQIDQRMVQQDQYIKQSLQREIEALKKIKHPNVIELKDVYYSDNYIYIIQEFCQDGELKQYIQTIQKSNMPFDEYEKICLEIAYQITQGMQTVHRMDIIHRDLKPQNILVHNKKIKIIDFGFCKSFDNQAHMIKSAVGSPYYMSPQILSKIPYTYKTDIWSFGMIFYELVFKKLPYYANSEAELLGYIQNQPIQYDQLKCGPVSKEVLQKSLIINEKDRASWDDLYEVLNKWHTNLNQQFEFSIETNTSFTTTISNRKSNAKKNIFTNANTNGDFLNFTASIQACQAELSYIFVMGQIMLELQKQLIDLLDPEQYNKTLMSIAQSLNDRMQKVLNIIKIIPQQGLKQTNGVYISQHITDQIKIYQEFYDEVMVETSKYKMQFAENILPSQISSVIQTLQKNFNIKYLKQFDGYIQRQILSFIDYITNYLRYKNIPYKDTFAKINPPQNTDEYFQQAIQQLSTFNV